MNREVENAEQIITFYQFLEIKREALGLNKEGFCKYIGLSYQNYHKIKKNNDLKTISHIAFTIISRLKIKKEDLDIVKDGQTKKRILHYIENPPCDADQLILHKKQDEDLLLSTYKEIKTMQQSAEQRESIDFMGEDIKEKVVLKINALLEGLKYAKDIQMLLRKSD